ncbi:MAG TPA: hypothetical protein VEA99_07270, partial [Gemmatimonadaceae bacterium]|nr:hypothetical protein [Gemmatimonadaceae bacterium]
MPTKTHSPLVVRTTLLLLAAAGCAEPAAGPAARITAGAQALHLADEPASRVVVDAGVTLGPVIRFERASTHSTSSPMPGEPTRAYMQGLEHDVVRTWIQTRYVYNNGEVDYNYAYEGSGVGAE